MTAGPHSAAANFYGYGEWRLESGDQSPGVTIMWTHGVPGVQMWNISNFQHIDNLQHKAPTELDVSPNISTVRAQLLETGREGGVIYHIILHQRFSPVNGTKKLHLSE